MDLRPVSIGIEMANSVDFGVRFTTTLIPNSSELEDPYCDGVTQKS